MFPRPSIMVAARGQWIGAALVVLAAGCQSAAVVGATCARASECPSPLVCTFGRCHAQCRQSRDCPVGARCVVAGMGAACTLDVENHCDTNVCPSPLVCVADQCQTTCANANECVAGMCTAGSCNEPRRVGIDAGTDDAAPADAGVGADAGFGACALTQTSTPVRLLSATSNEHLTIATSETTGASGPIGWVHVGGVGVRGVDPMPTAYVLTVPVAQLDAPPTIADLRGDPFYLVVARSIALRRNMAGDVHVLVAFEGSGTTSTDVHRGGVGFITRGTGTVTFGAFYCSQATMGRCVPTPTSVDTLYGRVALVGGAEGAPIQNVYRHQDGGMSRELISWPERFSGPPPRRALGAVAPGTFAEIVGTSGHWVAMPDPSSAASVVLWDTSADGMTPQRFVPVPARPARSRPALAYVGTNRYWLGYASAAGAGSAISLWPLTCDTTCVVSQPSGIAVATNDLALQLPALVETSPGIGLAYVVRQPTGSDYVQLSVLDAADPSRPLIPAQRLPSFSDSTREIIDQQIATVHDGDRVHLVAAVLQGQRGSGRGDEIWVASVSAPAGCF